MQSTPGIAKLPYGRKKKTDVRLTTYCLLPFLFNIVLTIVSAEDSDKGKRNPDWLLSTHEALFDYALVVQLVRTSAP